MTQQKPYMSEDDVYKKRIFYDNGIRYREIQARIVGEYKPPTPVLKSHANVALQSQSGLVQSGTSHYTAEIALLFYSKKEFADWFQFVGSQHKFYDEKGSVFWGIVDGSPTIQTIEMETKYMVTLNLVLIRKSEFEVRNREHYVDTPGHWAETYIDDLKERGIVTTYNYAGEFVQTFRPEAYLTRAECASMLMRTHRYLEKLLRGF